MSITKFDLDTYNRTRGLEGGAIYTVVEEDMAPLEMIVDDEGRPTRGGIISYYLASAILAALAIYIFVAL